MFRRRGFLLLPLWFVVLLLSAPPATGTTTLDTFSDFSCGSPVGTAFTVDGSTDCQQLPGVKSVRTTNADEYCAVTVYSDNGCNNDATLAPLHSCVANASYNSLSVDCRLPDGSWASADSSQTASFSLALPSGLSSLSSLPLSPTSVSSIAPIAVLWPPTPSAAKVSSIAAFSPATSSSAKVSSSSSSSALSNETSITFIPSVHILVSSSSSSASPASAGGTATSITSPIASSANMATTVTPPASSTTVTDQGGGNMYSNGNLSTNAQIAIGVVVPAVGVIVAVVFGLRAWNQKR